MFTIIKISNIFTTCFSWTSRSRRSRSSSRWVFLMSLSCWRICSVHMYVSNCILMQFLFKKPRYSPRGLGFLKKEVILAGFQGRSGVEWENWQRSEVLILVKGNSVVTRINSVWISKKCSVSSYLEFLKNTYAHTKRFFGETRILTRSHLIMQIPKTLEFS